uniref:Uncharacterized protein n=1 Tax=Bionectria ochroleuca TaxID=29856 RepID=A0A8H7NL41_BIOOC
MTPCYLPILLSPMQAAIGGNGSHPSVMMQLADISQPTWGPSRNPETDAGQLRKTYERRRLLVRVCSANASVAVAFLLAVLPTAFSVRLICNILSSMCKS